MSSSVPWAFGQDGLPFGEQTVDFVFAVDQPELLEILDRIEPLALEFRDIVNISQTAERRLVTSFHPVVNGPEFRTSTSPTRMPVRLTLSV